MNISFDVYTKWIEVGFVCHIQRFSVWWGTTLWLNYLFSKGYVYFTGQENTVPKGFSEFATRNV